jgi:hypothetical protein
MIAKAHEISLEAGSKMAKAMKDVIFAAAGLSPFAADSAKDLVNYMVRRGQMSAEEAERILRDIEDAAEKRKPVGPPKSAQPEVAKKSAAAPVKAAPVKAAPVKAAPAKAAPAKAAPAKAAPAKAAAVKAAPAKKAPVPKAAAKAPAAKPAAAPKKK